MAGDPPNPPDIPSEGDDPITRWAAIDDEYGQDILALAERDRPAAMALFEQRLQFGTAGLRGAMGPGPGQMNRLVVSQTTAGLMDWLRAGQPGDPVVAVGYDARHHSRSFAHDVVAGGGIEVGGPCSSTNQRRRRFWPERSSTTRPTPG